MSNQVKRALLSVHNKDGAIDFARGLDGLGVQLVSSGGTATALRAAGLPVVEVSELTGSPEILDGRVKTLHPKIHGGILARRDHDPDRRTLEQYGIPGIDLVCVNLYPFEQTVAKPGCTLEQAIENIDVGGPAMVRAAAKNFRYVYVVTRPQQYATVLRSLRERTCWIDPSLSEELAREAFAMTVRYDMAVHRYLSGRSNCPWPRRLFLEYRLGESLRYGENPHQTGAVYWEASGRPGGSGAAPAVGTSGPSSRIRSARAAAAAGLSRARQVSGKELSFNNLYDADAAWALVQEFDECAAVVIKHANPCGAALAQRPADAFERAYNGDPAAAFGGIVAFNRHVDEATAAAIARPGRFLEVIVAPGFSAKAARLITEGPAWGKNVRLLAVAAPGDEGDAPVGQSLAPEGSGIHSASSGSGIHPVVVPAGGGSGVIRLNPGPDGRPLDLKRIAGGLLVQSADTDPDDPTRWKVVSKRTPELGEYDDLVFAWKIVKHVKSNAIVLAKDRTLIGAGAGQMKRLDSSFMAVRLAGSRATASVAAGDAFFPFRDGLDELARAGVTAVIHPGGSKRDEEVVKAADQHGLAMIFTGTRHFKH